MNMEAFNRLLLESVGTGLAVVGADTHEVMFSNSLFTTWFPAPENGSRNISDLIGDIDSRKLKENEGQYSGEIEIKIKRRMLTISVNVSLNPADAEESVLMVECTNISKIKELEYMIESYSQLVEKNERQLRREKDRAENLLLQLLQG